MNVCLHRRTIIPADRKAYFAVATMLIDHSRVASDGEKITSTNFEQYVPDEHKKVRSVGVLTCGERATTSYRCPSRTSCACVHICQQVLEKMKEILLYDC